MILIGESDPRAGEMLEKLYRGVCTNQPSMARMNFVNAELTKISVNTFVTTKISYANMLAEVCEQVPGADARGGLRGDRPGYAHRQEVSEGRVRLRRALFPARQHGVFEICATASS